MSGWLKDLENQVSSLRSKKETKPSPIAPQMEKEVERIGKLVEKHLKEISDVLLEGKGRIENRKPINDLSPDYRWSLTWGNSGSGGFIRIGYSPNQWEPQSYSLSLSGFCTECYKPTSVILDEEELLQEGLAELLSAGIKHHPNLFI